MSSDLKAFYLFALMCSGGALATVYDPHFVAFAVWTGFCALRNMQRAGR